MAETAELYRIKTISFDLSNSILFIPLKCSPQSVIRNNLVVNTVTQEPNKKVAELELTSAVVDEQPEQMNFSEGNLRECTILPEKEKVKIKLIFKDNYNLSNMKVAVVKNCIIVNFNPVQPYGMNYYINTYRENSGTNDFREQLAVTTKTINKQDTILINDTKDDKLKSEIDSAFQNSIQTSGEVYTTYTIEDLSKDNRLRTRYYLFDSKLQDDTFRISGVGSTCINKPFLLDSPKRMVFDMPNSIVNPDLHGREFTLKNGDTLKIAQFNPTTARIVVTSKEAQQYIPVYSSDSQSVQFANPKHILTTHLPDYKSNIVKFNYQKISDLNNFFFEFDKPVIYAIKRTNEYLFIYFLNAEKYNDSQFHAMIKNTPYADMSIHLLSTGMRIKLPIKEKDNINTYLSPDGKLFKLSSTEKTALEEKNPQKIKELTKKEGGIKSSPKYTSQESKKVVVLDAGHGGKDCGALRGNILEKTINLDVCMKIQNILKKKGYKVYMTRTDDTYVSLEDRTIFTEAINPSAFVSVHVNSCNAEAPNGIETHYYNDNSIELADIVHKHLTRKINTTNRGLFRSRFYVINHTTSPAILVEIGFISNDKERQELTTQQRQQATAEGIAEGIIEFLKTLK